MRIGFIGLGVMGKKMAKNALKQDYKLKVFDVVSSAMEDLIDMGAIAASSPADVAANSDVVFTSLPNSQIVRKVALGEQGILEGVKAGTIYVDFSSITPKVIREISKAFMKKQVQVIDAPVSGGSAGAEAGTLTIMAGGNKDALDKVRPILNCMSKTIYHVGDVGAGNIVKLVNNLLLGINMVATAEALTLGTKAGIDPDILFEVVNNSSGNSYALAAKYPKFISKGNFEPGFMVDLQYKDLQLAVDTAKDLEMPLLMGNQAQQIFEMARAIGLGDKDISSTINIYENWGKTKVRGSE